jgi:miniconductance mechanosensitive channel
LAGDQRELATNLADFVGLAEDPVLFFVVLIAVAITTYAVMRLLLVPVLNRLMERTKTKWDDILASKGVLFWLALLGPALILYFGAGYASEYAEIWRRIILAGIIVIGSGTIDRVLSAALDIYDLYPFSKKRPIKALIQLLKLGVYIVGAVTVIAVLLGKSPLAIVGSITVMTAVLVLVFKDTLLSLIANIQLVANDLVRRDDWIQVTEFGADGEVIDITLHTVKVRNWDNTIVTIPTYKLVDGSFQNWRGMSESGGRRIKRSLLIDQTSVRFCDDELIERFQRIRRLRPHMEAKQKELESANASLGGDESGQLPLNRRALTNLGIFRAYVVAYLNENPKLHDDMTVMVRQRPPTPNGLPLEVYVFSKDTKLIDFEGVQADIFDHLLAALPYFDLRLFQYPTGDNLKTLKSWLDAEMVP